MNLNWCRTTSKTYFMSTSNHKAPLYNMFDIFGRTINYRCLYWGLKKENGKNMEVEIAWHALKVSKEDPATCILCDVNLFNIIEMENKYLITYSSKSILRLVKIWFGVYETIFYFWNTKWKRRNSPRAACARPASRYREEHQHIR